VVGSSSREALDTLKALYEPIIEQSFPTELDSRPKAAVPFVTTDSVSAEMIKYAPNTFLATKISFINEISNLCELVGADVVEVAYDIGLDGHIGSRIPRRPYAIGSIGAGHNTLVLRWIIGRTALRFVNGCL
jgi:UDPglucose 6-dehydrogenase